MCNKPKIMFTDNLLRRGYFGVILAESSSNSQSIPVTVKTVVANSPAENAGIKPNDNIVMISGKVIKDTGTFIKVVSQFRAQEKVDITILRNGQQVTTSTTIQPFPQEQSDAYEVQYQSMDLKDFQVRTILTRPKLEDKHPALLFIQGLDCSSIDAGAQPEHPYRQIMDQITRQGFVTLRVEKPGVGDSQGPLCSDVDFTTEVAMFQQALDGLAHLDFVDRQKIFIFGHSIGGIIAPIIAANTKVKGIAVYGTGANTWLEYEIENARRHYELLGIDPAQIDDLVKDRSLFYSLLLMQKMAPHEIIKYYPQLQHLVQDDFYLSDRRYPYFQQLYDVNLPEKWMNTHAAVLSIWGTGDYVSGAKDHQFIANIINSVQPGKAMFVQLDHIDHSFHQVESAHHSLKKQHQNYFNPIIISTLINWLNRMIAQAA